MTVLVKIDVKDRINVEFETNFKNRDEMIRELHKRAQHVKDLIALEEGIDLNTRDEKTLYWICILNECFDKIKKNAYNGIGTELDMMITAVYVLENELGYPDVDLRISEKK